MVAFAQTGVDVKTLNKCYVAFPHLVVAFTRCLNDTLDTQFPSQVDSIFRVSLGDTIRFVLRTFRVVEAVYFDMPRTLAVRALLFSETI